jgi:hypothetical protein
LQHAIALCRSDLVFHYSCLCSTLVTVHSPPLCCNSCHEFWPKWPSSSA